MKTTLMALFLFSAVFTFAGETVSAGPRQTTSTSDLAQWRAQIERDLKSETGWLTVVGLEWLKNSQSTIGSASDATIRLPPSAPHKLGLIHFVRERAEIEFFQVSGVTIDGQGVELKKRYRLKIGSEGSQPTLIKLGSVQFFLIKRKNGYGIRIRDQQAEARLRFKERVWFDANPEYLIEGEWNELPEPRTLNVPDVIGNVNEEIVKGFVSFEIKGERFALYPTEVDRELFFVFRDLTAGKETYGSGRFLSAPIPEGGLKPKRKITLDFNKAINPPCAFTSFATCPIAPSENRLKIAIFAGEKAPKGSGH